MDQQQQLATDPHAEIREEVAKLCARFPGEYWRRVDRDRAYPTEFVQALTEGGWLGALIPEGIRRGRAAAGRRRRRSSRRSTAPAAMPAPATPRCTSWAPS